MAFCSVDGVRIHYRVDGRPSAPKVVLAHSIGCDLAMWDPVVPALAERFCLLRVDARGHGASDAPPGDYSLATLGGDVLAAMDAAGFDGSDFVGLSLGGMVGQWLAIHAPGRFSRFVFANTSGAVPREPWEVRLRAVREGGMAAVADPAIGRFFSPAFLAADPPVVASTRNTLLATDPVGYAGCCCAIRDMDLSGRVDAPVLVVNGADDVSTPGPEHGDVLARGIAGSRTVTLPTAHLSAVEDPGGFAAAVADFLGAADHNLDAMREAWFERGIAVRRKVLGDAWVDASLARRTPFNTEFQDLITRVAWGEVWTRPGLDHRTRRLLVLATTIAMGRWEEFRLHVRAGLEQRGFSQGELNEVILQAAVYAGVPAANTAMREAEAVIEALA